MDSRKIILKEEQTEAIIERLTYQLVENYNDFSKVLLIGLQPRGVKLSNRIKDLLETKHNIKSIKYSYLDITFFRDDIRHKELFEAKETNINFLVEDMNVIFIDDVLYTGRSVRAAMSAIQSFGRPKRIELLVLIDRKFSRQLPIQPDYIGFQVDTISEERVNLDWNDENPCVYIEKN